jgi:excisionase family DNA binding protein
MPITRRTPISELPELLTPTEVADWLGIGKGLVYEMIKRDQLANVRLGRLVRVPRSALQMLAMRTEMTEE